MVRCRFASNFHIVLLPSTFPWFHRFVAMEVVSSAYLTPHLVQPVCYPAVPGTYICVVNSWSGGSQFDPVGVYSVGPAGTFLVVQSLGSTCTTLKNLGTPAAAARVSHALMCT